MPPRVRPAKFGPGPRRLGDEGARAPVTGVARQSAPRAGTRVLVAARLNKSGRARMIAATRYRRPQCTPDLQSPGQPGRARGSHVRIAPGHRNAAEAGAQQAVQAQPVAEGSFALVWIHAAKTRPSMLGK